MLTYMYVFMGDHLVWIISCYAFPEEHYVSWSQNFQLPVILSVGLKSPGLSPIHINMSIVVFVQLMVRQSFLWDFNITSTECVYHLNGDM